MVWGADRAGATASSDNKGTNTHGAAFSMVVLVLGNPRRRRNAVLVLNN